MYYILNETNQIIAADDNLLGLCEVSHIDELMSSIIQTKTTFDIVSDNTIEICKGDLKETFVITKTSLSSMIGHLTLVNVHSEESSVDTVENNVSTLNLEDDDENNIINSILDENSDETIEDLLLNTNDDNALDDLDPVETLDLVTDDSNDQEITFGDHVSTDNEVMNLMDEETPVNTDESSNDLELFDLVLDDTKKNDEEETNTLTSIESPIEDLNFDDLDLFNDTPKIVDIPEINIDIETISTRIGLSADDYNHFLNDFIDTALELEKKLQSTDRSIQSEAIGTLSHLSEVLHLPVVGDIIDNIANTNDSEQREVIESFYNALSQITTANIQKEKEDSNEEDSLIIVDEIPSFIENETPTPIEIEEEIEIQEEQKLEFFDEPETLNPIIEEEAPQENLRSTNSFGTISLEGIRPKHFDFQLEEAANDLSLPVELIEEFVHDFIEQAHIETKKLLEAYEEGDFDTIKKIGHLLKGASSNLRINALSDTLYKIQFCEDSSTLEPLIKDYWAHFLSFENQINVISN